MADLFNPGLPTVDDVAFPQPAFWLSQPSLSTEDFSTILWEILPETELVEQNTFPFLSVTPGIPSIHPQSDTIPTDGAARICYGKVAGEDGAPASNMDFPSSVPTIPLVRLSYNPCHGIHSHSEIIQPAPSPLAATFPADWTKIPQRTYNQGSKQLDFKQLEAIHFSTKGRPGINLRDALCKDFSNLDGRDDPMLQSTSGVISCRLLVIFLHESSGQSSRTDLMQSSLGTRIMAVCAR